MATSDVVVAYHSVLNRQRPHGIIMTDPRRLSLRRGAHRLLASTPLFWLLPIERTRSIFMADVAAVSNHYVVASGEAGFADRITHVCRAIFA
jgi:hypothetical protein